MEQGGEKIEQGDVEPTGWEGVAELADKGAGDVNGADHRDDGPEVGLRTEFSDEEIEKWFGREVFDNVNLNRIRRMIEGYAEKIDGNDLLKLQWEINNNSENGVELAGKYFADLLGLDGVPRLENKKLSNGVHADYGSEGSFGIIRYDLEQIQKDNGNLLVSLGHESLHGLQYQEICNLRRGEANSWRAQMYQYNFDNYVSSDDDIFGYRKQLVEREAYDFEYMLKRKLRDSEVLEFVDEHPEIYSDKNLEGIEQEMGSVFRRFDVNNFLNTLGVQSVDEFFGQIWEGDEVFIQKYVDAMSELVGLEKRVTVKLDDNQQKYELLATLVSDFDFKVPSVAAIGQKLFLRKDVLDTDVLLREVPSEIWGYRQREKIISAPEDERVKLYKENLGHQVWERQDLELARRQLIIRERSEFAETLIQILDEQATEEELMKLPLPKRVASRLSLRRNGRSPVMSKKYHVKRSK